MDSAKNDKSSVVKGRTEAGCHKRRRQTYEEMRRKDREYKRLRRANYTEEEKRKELEAARRRGEKNPKKHADYSREYMRRKRQERPDEERRKSLEHNRRSRAKRKINAEKGVVKPLSQRAIDADKIRQRKRKEWNKKQLEDLKNKDPVKYREYLDRLVLQRLRYESKLTEEQKEEQRQRRYLKKVALEATLTPEELEERRRKMSDSSVRSQRKRRENETEEEKQQRRIYEKIRARKNQLRKKLFKEGLSKEEVKLKADAQEDVWWREFYPEGKPPPKKRGGCRVQPSDIFCVQAHPIKLGSVEVFKFVCVKCHPEWKTELRAWQPVGVNERRNLLQHVKEKHLSFYFPCPNCDLLKYSKIALEIHTQYCTRTRWASRVASEVSVTRRVTITTSCDYKTSFNY